MVDSGRKGAVFLERYLALASKAHSLDLTTETAALSATIADLALLWDCSERSARQTLGRLEAWGLLE